MPVLRTLTAILGLTMAVYAQPPPQILFVHRDFLKPGSDTAYRQIEDDAARICVDSRCPHPYVGMESLTGPKEAWWLNGFGSPGELKQVAADYQKNTRLMAALAEISKRKQGLVGEPVEVVLTYQPKLSRGAPWSLGRSRFLVVLETKRPPQAEGTVFEAPDGTRWMFVSAQTLPEAKVRAAAVGAGANIFAVRPNWSMPASDWVAADPTLWKSRPAPR
jgi:hypothetical protein